MNGRKAKLLRRACGGYAKIMQKEHTFEKIGEKTVRISKDMLQKVPIYRHVVIGDHYRAYKFAKKYHAYNPTTG